MQIASVLIAGVEMVQSTLVRGFTISRDLSQRTGKATLLILAIPARLFLPAEPSGAMFGSSDFGSSVFGGPTPTVPILLPGAPIEIWDGSGPISTGSFFGDTTFDSRVFGGFTSGTKRFAGTVSKITPRAITLKENALGYTEYTLECQDYTALLDTAVIAPGTLAAGSDQDMIRYIIANTLPDINTDNVDSIATLDALVLNGVSARQALESIAAQSGGNFWVDENKALHYHSPTALPAPFGISDVPDGSTTRYALFTGFTYSEDFTNPGNRITVIGGIAAAADTVDDAASQSQYGRVFTRVFRDSSILTKAAATARANVELARYKQPIKTGKFTTREQGIDVGQLLPVVNQALRISGSFLVRNVTATWLSQTETRYAVQFGDWNPDLIRFLRSLASFTGVGSNKPTFNSTTTVYDADDTFVAPPGVTSVTVECWGPGGDGNQCVSGGSGAGGGGGGAGAYARSDVPVVPGSSYAVTVPAGNSVLPTWFGSSTTIKAAPGTGGSSGDAGGTGGPGGLASDCIGSTTISGGDGQSSPGVFTGGKGGDAPNGGGAGGAGGAPGNSGSPGVVPGGGGGGDGSLHTGGSGAHGRVKLTYSIG